MSDIKILIVDDEALIAEDISELCTLLGYEVVDTAHTPGQALNSIDNHALDLVLLDINLDSTMDGIEIAEYLSTRKNIPFIFITSYSDASTLQRAKNTKPIGYIVKPFNKEQLLSTIEISLHNYALSKVPGGLDRSKVDKIALTPLSEREFEMLNYIFIGKTNKQMAELEHISINTVKYHIKQLYLKMDANSRSSLLANLRQGL